MKSPMLKQPTFEKEKVSKVDEIVDVKAAAGHSKQGIKGRDRRNNSVKIITQFFYLFHFRNFGQQIGHWNHGRK